MAPPKCVPRHPDHECTAFDPGTNTNVESRSRLRAVGRKEEERPGCSRDALRKLLVRAAKPSCGRTPSGLLSPPRPRGDRWALPKNRGEALQRLSVFLHPAVRTVTWIVGSLQVDPSSRLSVSVGQWPFVRPGGSGRLKAAGYEEPPARVLRRALSGLWRF